MITKLFIVNYMFDDLRLRVGGNWTQAGGLEGLTPDPDMSHSNDKQGFTQV